MSSTSSQPSSRPLLVTRREAQALLGGISVETIRDLERRGLLPALKLSPWAKQSHAKYDVADIEALVASMKADAAQRAQAKAEAPKPPKPSKIERALLLVTPDDA